MDTTTTTETPAVTFTAKGGVVINYTTPFKCDDQHTRKFRLIRDGDSEGPWMWIHPDDVADYKADANDNKIRLGVTANDCLAGIPWGCVFPYVMQGAGRPECDMDKLVNLEGAPTPYKPLFEVEAEAALAKGAVSPDLLRILGEVLGADHALVVKLQALKPGKPE